MTADQPRIEPALVDRPRSSWTRRIQLIAFVMVAITAGASVGAAWAYWLASTTAGSNGASAATSVNAGATPTASAVGPAVTVSWAASTLGSGQAVTGYLVKRYDATTLVAQTILSACAGTVTSTSCLESSVPTGTWKYSVTPVFATNWVGAESAKSATVTVDATPPTNSITLSNVSGGAFLNGSTIYYAGAAAGSLTLRNAVADAGSGPASSQTAALTGTTTGWTHTPSTVSTPAGGPYVSGAFSWTAGTTSAPGEVVTGRDIAGNTATSSFTFVNDSTAPSAGSISYLDGYQPGLSVPVTFAAGTDGGSGLATRQLQRSYALLTNGVCGTFNSFTNIGVDNPTSVYTDSAVSNSTCYKYRFVVTDNVGNQTIATSASVSKVDYAGAVFNTTGLLSQWRLGEASAALISRDSFTGTTGTALSSHTGELGATWNHASGIAPAQIDNNRIHRAGLIGDTVDYVTAVPPSANYSVEADLLVKSNLAGDDTGVIGRRNGSNNFYLARWDQAGGDWQLAKYNGLLVNVLASTTGTTTLTVTETYRLKLEMIGSTLNLYVNGILTLTTTDSSLTAAGNAGIMDGDGALSGSKSSSTGLQIDNFQVTPSTYPRAADSKGSNTGDYKNGVTLGAAGALAGDTNTAAQFDGVNDYVQMVATTGLPTGAAVRSTELWFKTGSSAQQVLFAYGASGNTQEYGLWLNVGATAMTAWGFGTGNDKTFTMPAAMNDSLWHQVVETYDGTTLTLYIDGTALPTQAATRSTVLDMYGFSIGAVLRSSDSAYGFFFNGSIDEVSFYTTALTQTNVTNHYQLGRAPGADVTGPTGGSVDATGLTGTGSRYSASTSLSIALAKGSDPSGLAASGNVLQRATATLTSPGTTNGACGAYGSYTQIATDPASPYADTVTDQACYSYRYIVLDALGNATTYTSGDIKVDTTAPTAPALTFSAFSNSYWSGTGSSLYYRSAASTGSFTLTATSTDTTSGLASYSFPSLGTNWTATPGALGVDTYSWSGVPAAPGTVNVTATNYAGQVSATAPFTAIADSTAPSGGSISYVNGSTGGTTVSVTFAAGTDSGSGLGTALLQRASAPITGITCGSYGAFTTVTGGTNPTSPLVDTVTLDNCYKYQYVVSDNVGNTTTYSSASIAHTPFGAYYAFDAGAGTSAVDSSGNANTATLQAGAGWTTGKVGSNALNLNGGTTSWVSAPNPVIDTSQSYTVSTWVKLTSLTGIQTFASIDGTTVSPFYLQSNSGVFYFAQRSSDVTGGGTLAQVAGLTATVGTWYHVTGVYNSVANTIELFVNGVSQGSTTAGTAWKATGATTIGRAKWNGANTDYVNGALDETHFYDRALSASEISGLATGTNAYYAFDAGSGTTAVDFSGKANTGTLQAGAGWTTGKVGAGALSLNGTSTGWVDVAGPVINTSQSYTVAAWVKLNNVSGFQSLVGIDGTLASPFYLQTDGATGMFRFALTNGDTSAPGFTNIEGVTPVAGTWYRLVGVYDKTANTMTFYVNGVSQGTVTAPTTWAATGHTAIGRAQYNGVQVDFTNGAIDDVRFYGRALSAAEVAALP